MSAPFEPSAAAENTRSEVGQLPRRILLVGISQESRALTLGFLRRPGSEIEVADHAAAALDSLEREPFDLILIDLSMAATEGCEAAQAIRAWEAQRAHPRVPILALSADAAREQRTRCLDAGCDALVAKPLDEQALFEATRSCSEALQLECVPEIADLLPGYLAHRRADAETLWQAILDGNWVLVSRLGHDMKGSGKIYGLPRISAIGARIEASGKANGRREAVLALTTLEVFVARAAREIVGPAAAETA